jgi:peroxiredoxin Q/BCP
MNSDRQSADFPHGAKCNKCLTAHDLAGIAHNGSKTNDNTEANPCSIQKIPDFALPATGGQHFQPGGPGRQGGHHLLLPQGQHARLHHRRRSSSATSTTEFVAVDTVILGISRDSVKSHENFKAKQALPFELGSDADETVCNLFAVMKMKNMYGKQVRGVERSTFVIDRNGVLRREWRGVKVPGHVQEVLDFVTSL